AEPATLDHGAAAADDTHVGGAQRGAAGHAAGSADTAVVPPVGAVGAVVVVVVVVIVVAVVLVHDHVGAVGVERVDVDAVGDDLVVAVVLGGAVGRDQHRHRAHGGQRHHLRRFRSPYRRPAGRRAVRRVGVVR